MMNEPVWWKGAILSCADSPGRSLLRLSCFAGCLMSYLVSQSFLFLGRNAQRAVIIYTEYIAALSFKVGVDRGTQRGYVLDYLPAMVHASFDHGTRF